MEQSQNHSENTGKARNEGTTENSHIGHCTHTWESTNVKVKYSRFNIGNSAICTMNSNYRIAATLYFPETRLVCISVSIQHKENNSNNNKLHKHENKELSYHHRRQK
jgi:hypothetical protein